MKTLKIKLEEYKNWQSFLEKTLIKTHNPCRYLQIESQIEILKIIIKELTELDKEK